MPSDASSNGGLVGGVEVTGLVVSRILEIVTLTLSSERAGVAP